MTHLKNFPSTDTQEDSLSPLLERIQENMLELEMLKQLCSSIFTGKAYNNKELRFYNLLIKKAGSRKERNEKLFNQLIYKMIHFLKLKRLPGLAFYYSFHIEKPDNSLIETRKELKGQLLRDLCSTEQAPLNILFVDDDRATLRSLKKLMKSIKQGIDTFSRPQNALDHLRREEKEYDLIISDYRMPGMTGVDFINKAGEIEKYKNSVYVLYSTLLPVNVVDIPDGIYSISKIDQEALMGLVHTILIGREVLA